MNLSHLFVRALFVALVSMSSSAFACTISLPGDFHVGVIERTSANGVISIVSECHQCDPQLVDLEVTLINQDLEVVPGAIVEQIDGDETTRYIWKPEEDLNPGDEYTLTVNFKRADEPREFVITATEFMSELGISAVVQAQEEFRFSGEEFCCEEPTPAACSEEPACWEKPEEAERAVTLSVAGTLSGSLNHQYLFETRFYDMEGESFVVSDTRFGGKYTFEPTGTYCVEVTARRLGTDLEEQVVDTCLEEEQVLSENRSESEASYLKSTIMACDAPPAAELDYWCALFLDEVRKGSCGSAVPQATGCEAALELCPPVSDKREPGAGGAGASTDNSDEPPTEGCSFSSGARSSRFPLLSLVLGCLLAGLRRRSFIPRAAR